MRKWRWFSLGCFGLWLPPIVAGEEAAPVPNSVIPDISRYAADLAPPAMTSGEPAPGRRVKAVLPGFSQGDIYYSLYLPGDWTPGARFPVIVEYAGNGGYRNRYGDVSTGRVEDCSLGYGLSAGQGCVWLCLPFVDTVERRNALKWWGDVEATVAYCKQAVRLACERYGGDPGAVLICGFSRGALACNYIGLHDDEIAALWSGFFVASHYDGAREWPYADSDRASALVRLRRLNHRPVFVSHETYGLDPEMYGIVDTVNYLVRTGIPLDKFVFRQVPVRNHTDRWVLCDLAARRDLRKWFGQLVDVGKPKP